MFLINKDTKRLKDLVAKKIDIFRYLFSKKKAI